jgi:hypothetical protein
LLSRNCRKCDTGALSLMSPRAVAQHRLFFGEDEGHRVIPVQRWFGRSIFTVVIPGCALLGAGPESILPVVVMDSGLTLRVPRNDELL